MSEETCYREGMMTNGKHATKAELSKHALAAGNALRQALQISDSEKGRKITGQIAALADKGDVVVEWSASEINRGELASVCCCWLLLSFLNVWPRWPRGKKLERPRRRPNDCEHSVARP
jgi:hypothetical protein